MGRKISYQQLQENKEQFVHPCGGNGSCYKCRVQFLQGAPAANKIECQIFSEKEIADGWRLECQSKIESDALLFVPENTLLVPDTSLNIEESNSLASSPSHMEYGIAIDLGTTMVAVSLIELASGDSIFLNGFVNPQIAFGADVINRIKASNEGKAKELQNQITKAVTEAVKACEKKILQYQTEKIKWIVLSGNTTMIHLFLGLSTKQLGIYPFTPVTLKEQEIIFAEHPMFVMPGISAFVGGDIVSDLFYIQMKKQKKQQFLLIDLGTNGEMALFTKAGIYTASVAAGPALEAGNITQGMPAVSGAMNHFKIGACGHHTVETIDHAAPLGICGSGLLEAVYELRWHDIIDQNGTYTEEYAMEGYPLFQLTQTRKITLTQEDIRQVQLAKGAIRAGIEALLRQAKMTADELDRVYIAGSFGFALSVEKLVGIKMFPVSFLDKIEFIGNASLKGAEEALFCEKEPLKKELSQIISAAIPISLAKDSYFQEQYIEYMNF